MWFRHFYDKFYVTRTRYHRVGHIFITFIYIYSLSVIRDILLKYLIAFPFFQFEWKCFPYLLKSGICYISVLGAEINSWNWAVLMWGVSVDVRCLWCAVTSLSCYQCDSRFDPDCKELFDHDHIDQLIIRPTECTVDAAQFCIKTIGVWGGLSWAH